MSLKVRGTPSIEIAGTDFFHGEFGPFGVRATNLGFTGPRMINCKLSLQV